MGIRFRKSINLGKGFRINISKSGIGYSYGFKGYRLTKTAKGTIRQTASIPGTGLSFVEESSKKRQINKSSETRKNTFNEIDIQNGLASEMVSTGLDEIIKSAKKVKALNTLSTFGLICSLLCVFFNVLFLIPFLLFFSLKLYIITRGLVNLEYQIDDDQIEIIEKRMEPIVHASNSMKLWRIIHSSQVIDTKYSGGASSTVKRIDVSTSSLVPFPFKTNAKVVTFKSKKETLIFFPDKLFIMQGKKMGAISYEEINISSTITRFIEEMSVPDDAKVVGETWKYVNKSGGPDKRFSNNRKLPICLYGEISLKSASGLNTVILFSRLPSPNE